MRRGRRDVTGGLLTRARTAARMWCTCSGASAPSGYGADSNEKGRRQGAPLECGALL
jgi:hypothetical protein